MKFALPLLVICIIENSYSQSDGVQVVQHAVTISGGSFGFLGWKPGNVLGPTAPTANAGKSPASEADQDQDVVPSVDSKTQYVNLMLLDKKTLNAVTFSNTFDVVSSSSVPRSKEAGSVFDDFNKIVGSISTNESTTLFMANGGGRKFGAIKFDWNSKQFTHYTNPLLVTSKEEVLDSHVIDDRLALVTVEQGTSIVRVHLFEDGPKVKTLTYDFRSHVFGAAKRELYYALITNRAQEAISISPVYPEMMNSLASAADRRKIYFMGKKIYITIDDRDVYTNLHTRLITLDLETGEGNVELIKIPTVNCSDFGSNSYLFQDLLFQVVACDKELAITAKKLSTYEIVREFRTTKDDTIAFKNTPIIQEGSRLDANKRKAHENTKKFLNAIGETKAGMGICVNQLSSGRLEVILGSFKTLETTLAYLNTNPFAGPTFYYNSGLIVSTSFTISNNRSIYVKALLDSETLQSVDGQAVRNTSERVADYKPKETKLCRTVFWVNNQCYLGYYDKPEGVFRILRF